MSHEKTASTFDGWARSGRAERLEAGHGDVARQVIERMDIRPGHRVLDLGCGVGWATRLLAARSAGVQAIGIDISPAMIDKAAELSDPQARTRYEVGDLESLPFGDGELDRVFSMEALYYAHDLAQALSEIHRVLEPGGHADVVVDYYVGRSTTEVWADAVGLAMHHLDEAAWKAAFHAAGFGEVECTHVVDRRGPGAERDFKAGDTFPDWNAYRAYHEAGALWIHAQKA